MTITDAKFLTTAVEPKGYPDGNLPEIAFVGRSNVGKSSLINALSSRKALAMASGVPGKTRTINFFIINDDIIFVDLPGYGYAKAPKSEMKSWGKMAENYLLNRRCLKAVIFLLDIRRVPSQDDRQMYDWLKYYGHRIIIAATKTDKLNQRETAASLKNMSAALGLAVDDKPIAFSSVKKTGREELWESVNRTLHGL